VGEEAIFVYAPHEFLFVGELDVGECGVLFVDECGVGSVRRGAGEEGTVFGCVSEGGVCVFGVVSVSVSFEVGVYVG
jgi:hypothetical protein